MSLNYKTSIDIVNFHYAEITKSNNTIKYVDDFIIKSALLHKAILEGFFSNIISR